MNVLPFAMMVLALPGSRTAWQSLAPGMDMATILAAPPAPVGDSRITVIRVDPARWRLVLVGTCLTGESGGRTARNWCGARRLTLAINAGMFGADGRSHTGYLQYLGRVATRRANGYGSVAAFDPKPGKRLPLFHIYDLERGTGSLRAIRGNYGSVVQNMRLVRRPGVNVWGRAPKRWSEAALGEDRAGRILFIYSRSPFTMRGLVQQLLASGIGLVSAQHLEGGPEAQLYLHVGAVEREMFGSYETGFREDDRNAAPWPIPNALGVRPR